MARKMKRKPAPVPPRAPDELDIAVICSFGDVRDKQGIWYHGQREFVARELAPMQQYERTRLYLRLLAAYERRVLDCPQCNPDVHADLRRTIDTVRNVMPRGRGQGGLDVEIPGLLSLLNARLCDEVDS
jgi:hypothetical protein